MGGRERQQVITRTTEITSVLEKGGGAGDWFSMQNYKRTAIKNSQAASVMEKPSEITDP